MHAYLFLHSFLFPSLPAGRDCSQHKPSWFLVPCSSHNGESEDEQVGQRLG